MICLLTGLPFEDPLIVGAGWDKSLKKQLRRKEKALAKAAALLVL